MKIRSGFVSNSSSSSFIVVFPQKPKLLKELQDMMFPRSMKEVGMHNLTLPTETVCEDVLHKIQQQKVSASEEIIRESLWGYYTQHLDNLFGGNDVLYGTPEREDYFNEKEWIRDLDIYYDDREKKAKKFEAKEAAKFYEKHKDKFILVTSYSDNNPNDTLMEHGHIFRNLEHIQISNH